MHTERKGKKNGNSSIIKQEKLIKEKEKVKKP